ncbi:Uncharacterised protein [Mycobacterium tuberculosis]|nr:Uncharacterised protein [Mycobacterium tuberculosis]CPA76877.1 Uncharacterised protein [Mycobacterium tuberculosis]
MEARVFAVGHTAAFPEAANDLLFDLAEQRNELCYHGEVVRPGRTGQHAGAVGRQRVGRAPRVVFDDLPGGHAA